MKKSNAIIITLGGFVAIVVTAILIVNSLSFPGIDFVLFLIGLFCVLILATGITLGVMLFKKLGQVGKIINRESKK